jgi:uncharacterized protein YjgD (DUF1641 family)
MDQDMVELNQKIDLLTAQVQFLTEQARINERQREERAELLHDIMPVVNDAYRLSVEQLEEVEQYIDLADLLRLLKRLLRNGRNIEAMLDQLESMVDLVNTVGPLSDDAFGKAVDLLEQAEHKGYFVFAKGGMRVVDNIVTSFGEDDVRRLGDNIVLMLRIVQQITQPEMLTFVNNMVQAIDLEKDQPVETSMWSLWRQMQDPQVRRGLGLTLRVLRTLGAQTAPRQGAQPGAVLGKNGHGR